jgi:predicted phosphodiesterase
VKRAIISDIHGNLEALQAVLAHITDQRVDEIYCLGDIVGYGPNP